MYDFRDIPKDYPWICFRLRFGERVPGPNLFESLPVGWGDVVHEGLEQLEPLLRDNGLLERFTVSDVYYRGRRIDIEWNVGGDIDDELHGQIASIFLDMRMTAWETCMRCGKEGAIGEFGSGKYLVCLDCADAIERQKALPEDEKR